MVKILEPGEAVDDPTSIHPALTTERLQKLGKLILQARHSALEDHHPEKGDDAWSYGCTCYARSKFVIARHAGQAGWEWLSVISQRPEFIVGIDGVPLKFYNGEPDDPPVRAFQQRPREFDAYQLELANMAAAPQEVLRLIVCTDSVHQVDSLWLLRLSTDGEILDRYEVPLQPSQVRSFDAPKARVDIPKPTVRARRDETDREDEEHQAG